VHAVHSQSGAELGAGGRPHEMGYQIHISAGEFRAMRSTHDRGGLVRKLVQDDALAARPAWEGDAVRMIVGTCVPAATSVADLDSCDIWAA